MHLNFPLSRISDRSLTQALLQNVSNPSDTLPLGQGQAVSFESVFFLHGSHVVENYLQADADNFLKKLHGSLPPFMIAAK